MTRPTLAWLSILLFLPLLLGFPTCNLEYRGRPGTIYLTDAASLGEPHLTYFFEGDGITDCEPGEIEDDFGVAWRVQLPQSWTYRYRAFTRCTPSDPSEGRSRFEAKDIETVVSSGDDIGGCLLNFDFEFRLARQWAFAVGQCADGKQAAVGIERTAPNSWNAGLITLTGQSIDAGSFNYAVGSDAHWDGAKTWFGLTYVDTLSVARFSAWERSGVNWAPRDLFSHKDFSNVSSLLSPRISGMSPNTFVTFQTAEFGPPTALHYAALTPTPSAQLIATLGGGVPNLPGETFSQFGNFQSIQNGLTRGTFTAKTTPSNFEVSVEYDVSDSLSLGLRYAKDDPVPDTLENLDETTKPSYDGDRLGMLAQTNSGRFAYLADIPNGSGGSTTAGFLRSLIDVADDRRINFIAAGNHANVRGVTAVRAGLDNAGGFDSAILVQDVQSLEVARGGASAVYGSDAVAGIVNFLTGPQTGFDRIEKGSNSSNYGGATFWNGDLHLGNSSGVLYRWDKNLGKEAAVGSIGFSAGITGLAATDGGGLLASTASALYTLDPQNDFFGSKIGDFHIEGGNAVIDISDIFFANGSLIGTRLGGELGEVDPATARYTPSFQIVGLPGELRSATSNGFRVFAGTSTGDLLELLDCLGYLERFADEPEITNIGFGVLGSSGFSPIDALAAPEPGSPALGAFALATLAVLAHRRRTQATG